ncbi:MAG: hypothetical protein F4X02_18235 [Chloroflexi bacterium]|nr:hypothetical protein [Chloroflexota bacterium]
MEKIVPTTNSKQLRRRSIRLKGYDYRQTGAYFLTICTGRHAPLFGKISNGRMTINALGSIVLDSWQSIADKRSNLSLDRFVVMPNHVHGIILVGEKGMTVVSPIQNESSPANPRKLSSDSLGTIVGQFKGAVTKRAKAESIQPPSPIWQRNFYEHIIRDEDSLNKIRAYIVENPARWSDDSLYVE